MEMKTIILRGHHWEGHMGHKLELRYYPLMAVYMGIIMSSLREYYLESHCYQRVEIR